MSVLHGVHATEGNMHHAISFQTCSPRRVLVFIEVRAETTQDATSIVMWLWSTSLFICTEPWTGRQPKRKLHSLDIYWNNSKMVIRWLRRWLC